MRNFPISFLHPFGPTPKTSLPDSCRFVCPEIFTQIKTVVFSPFHYKSHFVLILRGRLLAGDLCRDVCRRHLCLTHGHVAHLWSIEVHAVADPIKSFMAANAHGPIDVYVAVVVCDAHV